MQSAAAQTPAQPVTPTLASATTTQQNQVWLGYITSLRLNEGYSWWNDVHYVPGAFYVLRTGLTHHLNEAVAATAGYAFVGLPVGGGNLELDRREHRPWAQLLVNNWLSDSFSFVSRLRYEMRYRHNVANGRIADGFELVHRLRLQLTVRYNMPSLAFAESLPYVSLGNEVLVNFGPDVLYNHFDQIRLSAGVGLARRAMAVQVGYMNRFAQLPSGRDFVMSHMLFIWVFHNLEWRRTRAPAG